LHFWQDVVRSLIISHHLLNTREIVLIHHTRCGMLAFTDDLLRAGLEVTSRSFSHLLPSLYRSLTYARCCLVCFCCLVFFCAQGDEKSIGVLRSATGRNFTSCNCASSSPQVDPFAFTSLAASSF
jgi:hypothetical protein